MLQGVGFTDDDLFVFATVLSPAPQTHTLPGPHARRRRQAQGPPARDTGVPGLLPGSPGPLSPRGRGVAAPELRLSVGVPEDTQGRTPWGRAAL